MMEIGRQLAAAEIAALQLRSYKASMNWILP
jgi:hypothetical protein